MDCPNIVIPYVLIRIVTIGFFAFLLSFVGNGIISSIILCGLLIFFITPNRPYWIYVIAKTFKRDFGLLKFISILRWKIKQFVKADSSVSKKFHNVVLKSPDKIALYTEEGRWTYRELFEFSNKIAHVLREIGVKRADSLGVLFRDGGGARHPAIWLGSSYLGAPVAVIPPQLKSTSLVHCIKAAKVKHLIYSHDSVDVIRDIQNDPCMKNISLLQYNTVRDVQLLNGAACMATMLKNAPATSFIGEINMISSTDDFMYLFTSGTTGLPKATIISHTRYCLTASFYNYMLTENDTIYVPLPLHHAAGSIMGVGQCILHGTPVVLRNKFSVSNFWKDCVKYNCTATQYIGETCRFLLNTAQKSGGCDLANQHKIRMMIGNGLRPSIWKEFQQTFNIPKICEFYGSTEGNASIVNIEGEKQAIGYIPRLLYPFSSMTVIKCDQLTGEPIRDENGLCIKCKPCEAGLIIGKLNFKEKIYSFTGYLDQDATKKKYLYDVVHKGDAYFNSGDIVVMDDLGYFYFRDRTGDTFRWRGENVSSTEVENVLNAITKLDTVVYGVEIPSVEGRAGMAVIQDVENKIDLNDLAKRLKGVLPSYALPLFIRIKDNIEFTTTFKLIKKDLQKESYDINKIGDRIYFLDQFSSKYIPLTNDLYNEIINGKLML